MTREGMSRKDQSEGWYAAAHGACRDGKHDIERRYRNTARLILGLPPLSSAARCIVRRGRLTTRTARL